MNLFHCHNIKRLEKITNNSLNKEIFEIIKTYNLDGEERTKMEDIERLMMNETEHYETAYFDGIEVGTERGINLGITKGRNEGINQNKREIAKSMLKENIDINLISKITGLSKEQIISL